MKPKPALKRVAIMGDAPNAAPVSTQPKSQSNWSGLTLLPKSETTTSDQPLASPYSNSTYQSWFRKYDSYGQVVEEGLCLGEDIPLFRWIYTYDNTGSKVQAVLLNASHCLLEKRVYDEAEQLTRKTIFAANGTTEEIDYQHEGKQNAGGRPGLRKEFSKAA